MSTHRTLAEFGSRLVILGFGCIGRGMLPLLLRHIAIRPEQVRIVCADARHRDVAAEYGVDLRVEALTRGTYRAILAEELGPGGFLLNLSVSVGSVDLIAWCQAHDVLYLDACIEPGDGGYDDGPPGPAQRSDYSLREAALALRVPAGSRTPTAVLSHGVNPGLVSHFVKRALLDVAAATGDSGAEPHDRSGWANLARRLGVKTIHIAERDTQLAAARKQRGEFVNTWSVEGFVAAGCRPAELGWGTHERHWPADARRLEAGSDAGIHLERPGAATRVRSWTPLEGPYHGFLITHGEAVSMADYLSLAEPDGTVVYRPTVHYAYHPCDDAVLSLHELAGKGWQLQAQHRELGAADIVSGMDELGVLLCGHERNAYWYGSRLGIDQARALCPGTNATNLQTAAGVLGGVVWAMRHPAAGVVDPEDMDFREVLEAATPYLGELAGAFSDWTPLVGRGALFDEDVDATDPWQFKNVRV